MTCNVCAGVVVGHAGASFAMKLARKNYELDWLCTVSRLTFVIDSSDWLDAAQNSAALDQHLAPLLWVLPLSLLQPLVDSEICREGYCW